MQAARAINAHHVPTDPHDAAVARTPGPDGVLRTGQHAPELQVCPTRRGGAGLDEHTAVLLDAPFVVTGRPDLVVPADEAVDAGRGAREAAAVGVVRPDLQPDDVLVLAQRSAVDADAARCQAPTSGSRIAPPPRRSEPGGDDSSDSVRRM